MAITLTTPTVAAANPHGKTLFHICGFSADWSGCEVLVAAPTAGQIFIERLTVSVLAAIQLTVGDGETDSAVDDALWTFSGTTGGAVYNLEFKRPVKLAANKAFTADGSGAGACVIEAEGFIIGA